jgi:Ser/Thr protein kinase RdoA (MazF antagonist)
VVGGGFSAAAGGDVAGAIEAPPVHGLAGAEAPPDWPPLTVAELRPVLALYPRLGEIEAVTWHSPRPFAASGLVACAERTVFVKRHDPAVRGAADLVEEHRFIAHVRGAGAAVAEVLAAADGRTCIAAPGGTYEVHGVAAGEDRYRDAASWDPFRTVADARAAGRALAELHLAAAGYAAGPRRTGLLVGDFRLCAAVDLAAALARRAGAEPLLAGALAGRDWRADLAQCVLPFSAGLVPHLPALAPLWTHNDFHASNLLWRADGAVASVLDFGLANRTSAMFDLATAIERNCVEWLRLGVGHSDIAQSGLAAALIAGYREVRRVPPGEARALPHVLKLAHVEFALSEMAYFHGVLHAPERVSMAYDDFLLGHAAWFATRHGREFLLSLDDMIG